MAKAQLKARSKTSATSKKQTHDFTIGVDLGGTKVAVALVDSTGRIVRETSRPVTPADKPELDPLDPYQPKPLEVRKHIDYVTFSMADAAREVCEALSKSDRKRILGVGLASAGPMDIHKGLLLDVSNIKGWKKVNIVDGLANSLTKHGMRDYVSSGIGFQNDAIAGALGEGWVGQAKKCKTYVMVTVGTGIGTGVILNGRPAQSNGMGSEWGHVISDVRGFSKRANRPYDSECEGFASGTGLVRQAKLRKWEFENARQIAEAARRKDKKALELFMNCSEALAGLFYTLSLGFNPEVFSVSGGMVSIQEFFLPQAIAIYQEAIRVKYPVFEKKIAISKLGTKAGIVGAARLPRL